MTNRAPDQDRQTDGQPDNQLPPLKTPITFRASDATLDALAYIQHVLKCDKTAAIELSIAWNAAHMATDVCTPEPRIGRGVVPSER